MVVHVQLLQVKKWCVPVAICPASQLCSQTDLNSSLFCFMTSVNSWSSINQASVYSSIKWGGHSAYLLGFLWVWDSKLLVRHRARGNPIEMLVSVQISWRFWWKDIICPFAFSEGGFSMSVGPPGPHVTWNQTGHVLTKCLLCEAEGKTACGFTPQMYYFRKSVINYY